MVNIDLQQEDTICALSTPFAPSAIAQIRVSGKHCQDIVKKIFRPRKKVQKPFMATFGDIIEKSQNNESDKIIDEAIGIFYQGPKSYTGEDSFEVSLHGNPLLAQQTIDLLIKNGCRLAQPGEFTLRAVLNNKMDLCNAEAVADLIHAPTNLSAQAALRNLQSGLGQHLRDCRKNLVDSLAQIEARMDFPLEDIEAIDKITINNLINQAIAPLKKLLASADIGQHLSQGAKIVLFGKPNAGKSTLLNKLLKEEKAIVFHEPGTTRDVLETNWQVKGIPVKLFDIAGIRKKNLANPIEAIGINKAKQILKQADIVLWLSENNFDEEMTAVLKEAQVEKIVKIISKADLLKSDLQQDNYIYISAKNNFGLDKLVDHLADLLNKNAYNHNESMISNKRQYQEIDLASKSLHSAIDCLNNNQPDEFIASELRIAAKALDRLLGTSINGDVLDAIFSKFCIGK